jgi:hypothetical protein
MLMVLRQWRWVSGFLLVVEVVFEQLVEWSVFLGQSVRGICGCEPRPLSVLVASPLGRSRGGRRTRFSAEVPSTRPARRLPSAPCPSLTVPFAE